MLPQVEKDQVTAEIKARVQNSVTQSPYVDVLTNTLWPGDAFGGLRTDVFCNHVDHVDHDREESPTDGIGPRVGGQIQPDCVRIGQANQQGDKTFQGAANALLSSWHGSNAKTSGVAGLAAAVAA